VFQPGEKMRCPGRRKGGNGYCGHDLTPQGRLGETTRAIVRLLGVDQSRKSVIPYPSYTTACGSGHQLEIYLTDWNDTPFGKPVDPRTKRTPPDLPRELGGQIRPNQ